MSFRAGEESASVVIPSVSEESAFGLSREKADSSLTLGMTNRVEFGMTNWTEFESQTGTEFGNDRTAWKDDWDS